MTPNDVPHIQAECSNCHCIYDMKYGATCPKCHMEGVRWARLVTEEEAKQYGDAARAQLRTALDRITEWQTNDEWRSKKLSPYQHEINSNGTGCADNCPACRWVNETELPPLDNDLHEGDHIILHALGVQWEGDNRP